jgi:amino acid adenylation domain-containing protein
VEQIVALLAIWKAGAAYLPLDVNCPPLRLRHMLDDARPILLITARSFLANLPEQTPPTLLLDNSDTLQELARYSDANLSEVGRPGSFDPKNDAYVIYTSGSTGKPKGVIVTHVGLPNLAYAHCKHLAIRPGSRVLQYASIHFDASVFELAATFYAGATLVLLNEEQRVGQLLSSALSDLRITHATLPPIALGGLEGSMPSSLSGLVVAGEVCTPALTVRWAAGRRMINAYGPTETTVCATMSEPLKAQELPSIGRPIRNTRVYVLDRALNPMPVGASGELYVAGVGLARGYLNCPTVTAERFLANPFGPPGSRMYRTGDLARWRSDGTLEFLGRVDRQVKIRGHRIELGEVEAVLAEEPGVSQVTLSVRDDRPGGDYLVAYVVMRRGARFDEAGFRSMLASRLPDYMLPSSFVTLDSLPLTISGKLDRKALPAPAWKADERYAPPVTDEERILCGLFADILKSPPVGVHISFFSLGGNSMLAAQLASRIRSVFGVAFPLRWVFESPSVSGLALRLRIKGNTSNTIPRVLAIRPQGELAPLFCLPPGGGLSWSYTGLTRTIGPDRPIYGLQSRYIADGSTLPDAINAVVEDDLDAIRTIQPRGPYHLLGWSFGGNIAHALACRLHQLGEAVAFLGLLDSFPSREELSLGAPQEAETLDALAELVGLKQEGCSERANLETIIETARSRNHPLGELEQEQARRIFPLIAHNAELLRRFQPEVFPGRMTLFVAAKGDDRILTPDDWAAYSTQPIITHKIECTHAQMIEGAAIDEIGRIVEHQIAKG